MGWDYISFSIFLSTSIYFFSIYFYIFLSSSIFFYLLLPKSVRPKNQYPIPVKLWSNAASSARNSACLQSVKLTYIHFVKERYYTRLLQVQQDILQPLHIHAGPQPRTCLSWRQETCSIPENYHQSNQLA